MYHTVASETENKQRFDSWLQVNGRGAGGERGGANLHIDKSTNTKRMALELYPSNFKAIKRTFYLLYVILGVRRLNF